MRKLETNNFAEMDTFGLRTIDQSFPEHKRVLLRVDFNVPLGTDGKILDIRRIENHIPVIKFLLSKQAQLILVAHLGQPEGKVLPQFSFAPLLPDLQRILNRVITLQNLEQYQSVDGITLLENIRFYPGEEANDPVFAKCLANLADVYVNDAFSVCHRAHASTVGVTQFLPSYAGFALNQEVKTIQDIVVSPARPVTLLIGGKKVSDKIGVLQHLLPKVDHVLIGGACATTFAAALGQDMQNSFVEQTMFEICKEVAQSDSTGKLLLPADFVNSDGANLDIGATTITQFAKIIQASKTVIWAGPMGKYEDERFNHGNAAILAAIAESHATSLIGGGDTIAALQAMKDCSAISFVSLGGGAMLAFLEKETLPGIEVLRL